MIEIQKDIDNYYKWLKDRTILKEINDWVEITTPFLDRHNDFIQIYTKKDGDNYILSDDSYTINDLESCGLDINSSEKRRKILNVILNSYGITLNENKELIVKTTRKEFTRGKHSLIQAILSIDDLFFLADPYIKSIFMEDVKDWLKENKVRFTPQINFPGKTGYVHRFDFIIPGFDEVPERILKAINKPNDKNNIESLIMAWLDIKELRDEIDYQKSSLLAVLNDNEEPVKNSSLKALQAYSIVPLKWKERNNPEILEQLIA